MSERPDILLGQNEPRQMPDLPEIQHLQLFFGDANPAEARVYARLPGQPLTAEMQLIGQVTGPYCGYARTLDDTTPLKHQAADGQLMAEAVIPDPCFWTPELPFQYQAVVELRKSGEAIARTKRLFAIRPLGPKQKRLYYAGKPWVLRGAARAALLSAPLEAWHSADLAMVVESPDDEVCKMASNLGVMIAAVIQVTDEPVVAELERLARWPAVALAVVPETSASAPALRSAAGNLLLAQRFSVDQPLTLSPWAQVAFCEVGARVDEFAKKVADVPIPVIALRSAGSQISAESARLECDVLQAALAGSGVYAGYLV